VPGDRALSIGRAFAIGIAVLIVLPLVTATGCTMLQVRSEDWRTARRDSSGQAPDPATTADAVVQVYAARTVGMRGAFAVHTWIAVKPAGATDYTRYEVIGWGVARGFPALRVTRGNADNFWFGAEPQRLVDRRGEGVNDLIKQIEAAARSYPYAQSYRTWPGPNSNTFVAHVGRAVPELRLDLPPTAIGKDFLPNGDIAARAPSGTGYQISLYGVLGVLVALEEGVELNLLGLSFGLDFASPAIKLPGVGRIGFRQ
jgi:hypothetical protein